MFKGKKIFREIIAAGGKGVSEYDLFRRYKVGRVWMKRFCRKCAKRGLKIKLDPEREVYFHSRW